MTPPSLFPSLALHAIIVGLDLEVSQTIGGGSLVALRSGGHVVTYYCDVAPSVIVSDLEGMLSEAMALDPALLAQGGGYHWTQRPPSLERSRVIARAVVAFAAEALRVNGLAGLCVAQAPGSDTFSAASVGSVGPLPPMAEA